MCILFSYINIIIFNTYLGFEWPTYWMLSIIHATHNYWHNILCLLISLDTRQFKLFCCTKVIGSILILFIKRNDLSINCNVSFNGIRIQSSHLMLKMRRKHYICIWNDMFGWYCLNKHITQLTGDRDWLTHLPQC